MEMASKNIYHESLYQFDQPERSYWEATVGENDDIGSPLIGHHHADVAIIGGGYTGLSAALHLARDYGLDVRVLEAGHIGWGASGRNGGFCSIGGAKMSMTQRLAKFGVEETKRFSQHQKEAVELVAALGEDEGIEFDRQGQSEITVAESPALFESLKSEVELSNDVLGLSADLLTAEEFREQGYDGPRMFGALKLRPSFGLHPLKFARGLGRAAIHRGAKVHPHSEVASWRKVAGEHLLTTREGTVRARHVIVTGNGYLPEHLHKTLSARILPMQSHIVVTRPLSKDELAAQSWTTEDPIINTSMPYHYIRMLPDNRLMVGGRGDFVGTPEGAAEMARKMRDSIAAHWPAWKDVEIEYNWRGLVGFNRSLVPSVGRFDDDPTVFYGFGYHGNGVNTANWVGKAIADWMAGPDSGDVTGQQLPAMMRGMTPRFPFPMFRRLYGYAGYLHYNLKSKFGMNIWQ